MQTWVNSSLGGGRHEFLSRGRQVPLDESHDKHSNGYRPRRISLFGLGEIELKVPSSVRIFASSAPTVVLSE